VITIQATFQVTTPLFCGGADGSSAELRPSSVKGVLRFWWRACAWSRFDGDLTRIRDS
jgi:CRISPR-associated protein Cmr1